MRMMINWELCKQLQFDYTDQYYVYKSESLLENRQHTIHWDFGIKIEHTIQTGSNQNEKKWRNSVFRCSGKAQSKTKRKRKFTSLSGVHRRAEKNYETWRWQMWLLLLERLNDVEMPIKIEDWTHWKSSRKLEITTKIC